MKILVCVAVLLILQYCTKADEDFMQHDELLEAEGSSNRLYETQLQCLLETLTQNSDPLPLGDRKLDLDIPDELIMNMELKNMVLTNLRDTVGNYLSMSIGFPIVLPLMDIDITIPELTITADHYKLWADIFLFEIVGEGKALLHFRDVNLKIRIRIRPVPSPAVQSVTSSISIREAETHLEGLMDSDESSEYMNRILSDMIPIIVEEAQTLITDEMNAMIKEMVTDVLATTSITVIMSTITKACDDKTPPPEEKKK